MAKEFKTETQKEYADRLEQILKELPDFCRTFFSGKRSLSKITAVSYAGNLRSFFLYLANNNTYFADKIIVRDNHITTNHLILPELDKITSDDIDEFAMNLEKNGCSKETVEHYISALSSMWNFFVRRHQLTYNPVDAVERQKTKKEHIIRLSDNEREMFLKSVNYGSGLTAKEQIFHKRNKERDYAIYKLFLGTGMRVSELAGIDLTDINFDDKSINIVRKGGNEQKVYFSDTCENALRDYMLIRSRFKPLENEKALFLSPQGKRLSIRSIQKLTTKYIHAAIPDENEHITTHKLRSTYATDLLEKTGDIKMVSEVLGHAHVTTTEKYAEYIDADHKKIRNILEKPQT